MFQHSTWGGATPQREGRAEIASPGRIGFPCAHAQHSRGVSSHSKRVTAPQITSPSGQPSQRSSCAPWNLPMTLRAFFCLSARSMPPACPGVRRSACACSGSATPVRHAYCHAESGHICLCRAPALCSPTPTPTILHPPPSRPSAMPGTSPPPTRARARQCRVSLCQSLIATIHTTHLDAHVCRRPRPREHILGLHHRQTCHHTVGHAAIRRKPAAAAAKESLTARSTRRAWDG